MLALGTINTGMLNELLKAGPKKLVKKPKKISETKKRRRNFL